MSFTRDEIARGEKRIDAVFKEAADATAEQFRSCLFRGLVDDSWKVQLRARISELVFGTEGAGDRKAGRISNHGEGEPERYLRNVKRMAPENLFGARDVEEESGSVAGVSETTLKKVVIQACNGKRMKPEEVEFFKKKCNLLKYWPGEVIFEEGSTDTSMMGALLSGLIDAYVGGQWVDRIDENGVLVGDVGFFTGMPRTATLVAAGEKPTILLRFGHDAERGMKLNPSLWGEAVASAHLSHAMQLLNKKILKLVQLQNSRSKNKALYISSGGLVKVAKLSGPDCPLYIRFNSTGANEDEAAQEQVSPDVDAKKKLKNQRLLLLASISASRGGRSMSVDMPKASAPRDGHDSHSLSSGFLDQLWGHVQDDKVGGRGLSPTPGSEQKIRGRSSAVDGNEESSSSVSRWGAPDIDIDSMTWAERQKMNRESGLLDKGMLSPITATDSQQLRTLMSSDSYASPASSPMLGAKRSPDFRPSALSLKSGASSPTCKPSSSLPNVVNNRTRGKSLTPVSSPLMAAWARRQIPSMDDPVTSPAAASPPLPGAAQASPAAMASARRRNSSSFDTVAGMIGASSTRASPLLQGARPHSRRPSLEAISPTNLPADAAAAAVAGCHIPDISPSTSGASPMLRAIVSRARVSRSGSDKGSAPSPASSPMLSGARGRQLPGIASSPSGHSSPSLSPFTLPATVRAGHPSEMAAATGKSYYAKDSDNQGSMDAAPLADSPMLPAEATKNRFDAYLDDSLHFSEGASGGNPNYADGRVPEAAKGDAGYPSFRGEDPAASPAASPVMRPSLRARNFPEMARPAKNLPETARLGAGMPGISRTSTGSSGLPSPVLQGARASKNVPKI